MHNILQQAFLKFFMQGSEVCMGKFTRIEHLILNINNS